MIIRLRDCPLQAWKNGLGRTREIAVHPQGAGSDDFIWRVSMAEVDSAAPFSVFPGIDRQIALLDGDGFRMTLDQQYTHALVIPFEPFAFPGEAAVSVELAGGPTRDFNLMVRRECARGEIDVWKGEGIRRAPTSAALVHCARGRIDSIDGQLAEGDAWLAGNVGDKEETAFELHENAVVMVVCIRTI
jgi:uncharacterized protein